MTDASGAPTGQVIWVSTTGRAGASGSAADPYRSIQEAVDHAPAGAVVMVKAGVYTENVSIVKGGTSDAPLTILSADGRGAAQIKPANGARDTIEISRADHVVLDGLSIEGPASSAANAVHVHAHVAPGVFDPASHVVVRNCDIAAKAGDGVKLSKAEHVSLVGNAITGSTGAEEAIDCVGVRHLVIAHNEIKGAAAIAIAVKGGSEDVLIEANHIDGAGNYGIGVGGHTEEAYFWPGFIGAYRYEARDVRVVGNEIENTKNQGVRVLAGHDVEITGNWIHGVAHQNAISVSATGTVHNPPWPSADVVIAGNSLDRAAWLGGDQAKIAVTTGNRTDGAAPAGWSGAGLEAPAPAPEVVETTSSAALDPAAQTLVLRVADPASTSSVDLAGNAFAQTLEGNAGANRLDGGGGADILRGFGGDDVYVVDDAGDLVFELEGGGLDRVLASVSFRLGAGQPVERLEAASPTSAVALDLTGNERAQTLVGNAGRNLLDGGGGADVLQGLGGDDVYIVDDAGDRVIEAAGAGVDTVRTSVSYALGAGQHLERLETVAPEKTSAVKLTGNEFGQTIVGNAGDNVIVGRGGADVLIGGAGRDAFVFDVAVGAGEADRIADFSVPDDTIRLENDVFRAVGASGVLAASKFRVGSAAQDADDAVIYNPVTGALYYDSNGAGAGGMVQIAQLSAGLQLTEKDFLIT
ncbi:MAG TPA: right-handed parallel beta-helix repeat-containing protein [Beijerinckiaceae bacterium]